MEQQHQQQLQQQLAASEAQVAALREIAEAASELQSQDVQAAKVIELSKKNRSLNLLLEKERHKVAKLQQALSEAAAAAQEAADKKQPGAGDDAAARELAAAKERLHQVTNRIGQMEQKVFLLEGENKRLARALQREVGADVPLAKVLDEGSDWKGRREQIVHLKDTIRQLREAAAANAVGPGAAAPGSAGSGGAAAKHESAHRALIGKLSKEREAEMGRMAAELEAAKRAAEALRLQYTGASSRRKVLEEEVAGLKEKLGVVLQKTKNDDRLIGALRRELAGRGGCGADGSSGAPGSAYELQELQEVCSQLEEQVEQQQKVIRYLQAQQQVAGGMVAQPRHEQQQQQAADEQNAADYVATQQQQQRPGTSGVTSALRQQLAVLQEENSGLRAQLLHAQQVPLASTPSPAAHTTASGSGSMREVISLQLTESQRLVLQEAKEAVLDDADETSASAADALPLGGNVGSDAVAEAAAAAAAAGSLSGDGDDEALLGQHAG